MRRKYKCDFCKHDSPKHDSEQCITCKNYSNFEVKAHMNEFQYIKYKKLIEKEQKYAKVDFEFDRTTALRVLQDISNEMYASNSIFGEPTLVIRRDTFELIRHKWLD